MLRLPVAVLMARVGRPDRDPDGEERQEGGDEIGARVGRLGEKAETSVASPVTSLTSISTSAAATDMRAMRRCGLMAKRLTWVRGESGDRREVRGGLLRTAGSISMPSCSRDRAEPRVQVPHCRLFVAFKAADEQDLVEPTD